MLIITFAVYRLEITSTVHMAYASHDPLQRKNHALAGHRVGGACGSLCMQRCCTNIYDSLSGEAEMGISALGYGCGELESVPLFCCGTTQIKRLQLTQCR
jgi:hypothetical protein